MIGDLLWLLMLACLGLAAALAARPCPLRPGLHVQVYLDKLPGADHAAHVRAFAAECARLAADGVVGVVAHGFPGFTRADFEDYALAAGRCGLQCSVAFGLSDYWSKHAEDAARRIAAVACSPFCAALFLDAEGGWENEAGDRVAATALGRVLRELLPDVWICDQPWPVPTLHGSFPDAEFAAFIDASARQFYFNDWRAQLGRSRVRVLLERFTRSVATLLRRIGPVRQLWTVQGYGWDDVPADLVDVLLRHADEPLIVWSEPEPDDSFRRCARAAQTLARLGYVGPDAVQRFQRAYNADAAAHPERSLETLDVDNRAGEHTLTALEAA